MSVLDLKLVQRQKLVVNLTHWGIGVNSMRPYTLRGYYFGIFHCSISVNFIEFKNETTKFTKISSC
jgi:hypothetical protein